MNSLPPEVQRSPQHHLLSQVEECLLVFDSKRPKNKFLAFGLKLFAASLSAATTILLGISYQNKPQGNLQEHRAKPERSCGDHRHLGCFL